jgi:type II secretory pathway component PulJ
VKRIESQRGLTLLELLIAIVMLTAVIVIIGASVRLGYRSTEAGEKTIEAMERLRRSVSVIDAQIQSSMPLTFDEQGTRSNYFKGERYTLRFVTNYSLWGGRNGFVVVNYRVESDGRGKQTLIIGENVVGIGTPVETALLKDCDIIEFQYFEKGLTPDEAKWVDAWAQDLTVPERIWVHFRYRGWDHSVIIPTRARGIGA